MLVQDIKTYYSYHWRAFFSRFFFKQKIPFIYQKDFMSANAISTGFTFFRIIKVVERAFSSACLVQPFPVEQQEMPFPAANMDPAEDQYHQALYLTWCTSI